MEATPLPPLVECERVVLKKLDKTLAEVMFSYIQNDRQRLGEFLPWVDGVLSVEDELRFIADTHDQWAQCRQFVYGLFRKDDQCYLGNISIHSIEWRNGCCEIGYWLLGQFEGHGYIAEAVKAVEDLCFQYGFHRIEICCSSANLKSAGVPKRCGYTLDGVLRQNRWEHGKYADTLVFGKVRSC